MGTLNVPAGPLIGRAREIAAACRQLRSPEVRLVTLTGPPGVGKTRVAAAVATRVAGDFERGVAFVDLAPLTSPVLVAAAIGRVMAVEEDAGAALPAILAEHLGRRRMLLVLDNFEHLLPAAGLLSDLLAGCPGLRLLVTSRARLQLRDEHCLPIAPLSLADALSLFVRLAKASRPDFVLGDGSEPAAAGVCRSLDGLPLALELAAPWLRVLTLAELRERLRDPLGILVSGAQDLPPRQRSLQAALAWSHLLLSPHQQILFRRASVFAGGATLEAFEAVCQRGLPEPVVHLAAGLVDANLMVRESLAQGGRLVMLDTVRAYGLELLEASGERDAMREAHARHFATLAVQAAGARLPREHDNLQAALRWAQERGQSALQQQLAAGLGALGRSR